MKTKKSLLLLLFSALTTLHLWGCSNSDQELGSTPTVNAGNEVVMYEANPRVFAPSGSLNAIANRLDEIKALGVNTLWLMPIYEQGVIKAIGSPYCVKDYKKVGAEYGTLNDLKSLVQQAHNKGIKVILDWVANHTSWDNQWISNKSWYTQDTSGNIIQPEGTNWADVADLNYDNADMRKAMIEAMKYWVQEADVDGYRCDYAEGVPDDFWKTAITELKTIKGDDLLMLAEGSKASLFADGFDVVYGWDFAYKLQEVYAAKADVAALFATHKQEYLNVPTGKQRLRYTTNHDMATENSSIEAYNGEQGSLSAFVIAATLGGTPLIYSSQEIGYGKSLSFFSYQPMDWSSNADCLNVYKQIMDVYKSSQALQKGELKTYSVDKVACYYRSFQQEHVFVVVNTSGQAQTVKMPIERVGDRVKNLLDNVVSTVPSAMTVAPYHYYIWLKE